MKGVEPSQRQLRVGEELRHALSAVLMRGDLRDPALSDVSITVTEVRVSPDLRNATAFIMPLGGDNTDEVLAALKRASAFLRGQVSRQVRLKYSPSLSFQADQSFDEAQRIDDALRRPEVVRDLHPDQRGLDLGDNADGGRTGTPGKSGTHE